MKETPSCFHDIGQSCRSCLCHLHSTAITACANIRLMGFSVCRLAGSGSYPIRNQSKKAIPFFLFVKLAMSGAFLCFAIAEIDKNIKYLLSAFFLALT